MPAQTDKLKSGQLVKLVRSDFVGDIWARRVPETLTSPRSLKEDDAGKSKKRIVICEIPDGAMCLYIASKRDTFSDLMASRHRRLQSKHDDIDRPRRIVFHYVLWGERPVWVSSEDCNLAVVT